MELLKITSVIPKWIAPNVVVMDAALSAMDLEKFVVKSVMATEDVQTAMVKEVIGVMSVADRDNAIDVMGQEG